jgi:hypothetical protein
MMFKGLGSGDRYLTLALLLGAALAAGPCSAS